MIKLAEVRTSYVRFFARATKFLDEQLRAIYGRRWRVSITADGDSGWNVRFTHWDVHGLESSESFGITNK